MCLPRGCHVPAAAEMQTTEEKEKKQLVKNNKPTWKDRHFMAKGGPLVVRRPNMLPPTLVVLDKG